MQSLSSLEVFLCLAIVYRTTVLLLSSSSVTDNPVQDNYLLHSSVSDAIRPLQDLLMPSLSPHRVWNYELSLNPYCSPLQTVNKTPSTHPPGCFTSWDAAVMLPDTFRPTLPRRATPPGTLSTPTTHGIYISPFDVPLPLISSADVCSSAPYYAYIVMLTHSLFILYPNIPCHIHPITGYSLHVLKSRIQRPAFSYWPPYFSHTIPTDNPPIRISITSLSPNAAFFSIGEWVALRAVRGSPKGPVEGWVLTDTPRTFTDSCSVVT